MATVARIRGFGSKFCFKDVRIALRCSHRFFCSSSSGVKIYTKKGDKGYSYTFLGERRPKEDQIFEALGSTDELSSAIGLASEFCEDQGHDIVDKLQEIQCILQDVGANIATPRSSTNQEKVVKTHFPKGEVELLEKWIDGYHSQLPKLTNFILPSGGKSSASLHLARSICRRAERRIAPLVRSGSTDSEVLRYMNSVRYIGHRALKGKNTGDNAKSK